jgi:hypothetical protein
MYQMKANAPQKSFEIFECQVWSSPTNHPAAKIIDLIEGSAHPT